MQKLKNYVKLIITSYLVFALVVLAGGLLPQSVLAAALVNKFDTLSSQKISTPANHEIVFRTPTGVAVTGRTISLTFPSGFNMNSLTFADIDFAHSAGAQSSCTGVSFATDNTIAAAAGAGTWGAALAGQVVTLTAPTDSVAIAANSCLRVKIGTNATTGATGTIRITNHSTPATYQLAIGGTFADTGNIAFNILTDDQVAVTAQVSETLSFTLSSNAIGFGALGTGAAKYATTGGGTATANTVAHTIDIATNAANGYTATVAGNTLTYGSSTIDAIGASAVTTAIGTEQFGINISSSGGSGTVSAPYATASNYAFDSAAFPDEIVKSTVASAATTYSLRYIANIAALTEAGEYSSTLTYVATANF